MSIFNPFAAEPDPGVQQTEQSSLNFMNELQGQQQAAFNTNQAALSALSSAWAPVLQSGAVPYGYSAGLDSLLKSNIISQGATATSNAENAAQLQERQATGGAPGAQPTGAQEAINAEIEAKGQQTTATNLSNEKIAGYQQGETNLNDATKAELGIAGGANEVGLAGASTQAGDLGLNAAKTEYQENQANSLGGLLNSVTGAVGDVAGIVSGVGNITSMFGAGGSGGGGASSSMPASDYINMSD